MRVFLALPFIFLALPAPAEEESPAEAVPAEAAPEVKDLGEGRYQIGEVTFDENSRHISFPTRVNMTEGLLEYAIVHEKGKVHESLLITTASALHINVALKLLNYKESPEQFPILNEDFESTGKFPDVPEETRTAARLRVELAWKQDGEDKEATLNDWIYHIPTEKPMRPDPWLYSGSYVHEGKFAAESSGDYFAIFLTKGSIVNFAGDDNDSDEVWIPTPKVIPPPGTPVTVTIAPLLEKKTETTND